MSEEKGDSLVAAAEKKLKSWSLFGSGSKNEEACEFYDKAAAQYKLAKEWDKAGETYLKAAELQEKMKQEHDAVQRYTDAAKAFKNSSVKDAVKAYKIAVSLHQEANRFSQAAKIYKEIAEMEEKEGDFKGALKAYGDAADMFQAEDAKASMNQMNLKVAELSAKNMDYTRAIEVYEQVIASSLESTLLAHSCKDYMFKAGLCAFVVSAKKEDMSFITNKLEKYEDMHPAFGNDRNCDLLRKCVKAFDDDDVDAFTDHVFKYDRISTLDNWVAAMLLEVKNVLKTTEEAGVTDGGISMAGFGKNKKDMKEDDWQNEGKGGGGDDDFLA